MQLKVGSIIEVHGWVMLAGLDAGKYKVQSMPEYHGQPTYQFTKPKGKKVVARHYTTSVDAWVSDNINRIEVL